jgi:hypothetical protein
MSDSMLAQREARRQDIARHMLDRASAALIYLGIVLTFTAVTLIGGMVWLVI